MPDKIYVIPVLIAWLVYLSWRGYRYYKLEEEIPSRFTEFESTLGDAVDTYECFTNNHPHVWGKVNYRELKEKTIASPHLDGKNLIMFFMFGDEFSLKVDEKQKFIYVAVGTDSFDWDSLCHEEEWRKRKVVYH
jgi:hypothetical protein